MKYIRTKDNIYKAVLFSPLGFVRIDKGDGTYPDILTKNLVGNCIADTIEELCDGFYLELDTIPINERFFSYDRANEEFVGVDKTKCVFVVYKTSPIFQKMKGFIKTDKGLIYVAKMNDKGELELL